MPTLFASGEFADAMSLLRQFGPFFLAVVFFLWRDWKREDRLSNRLDQLEDEQREVILPLVKDCSSVITRNSAVMEQLISTVKELPCVHPSTVTLANGFGKPCIS